MDIDAIGKHVTGLVRFKAELQTLLPKLKMLVAKMEQATADPDDKGQAVSALTDRVDILTQQVGLAQSKFGQVGSLQSDLSRVSGEVDDFKVKFPPEQVDALAFMLSWFQDNREGLEALLSLGDDADTTDTAASGASPGASGAAAGQDGTQAAPATETASTASTGPATAIPVNTNPASPANPVQLGAAEPGTEENPLPSGAETLSPGPAAAPGAPQTAPLAAPAPATPNVPTGF